MKKVVKAWVLFHKPSNDLTDSLHWSRASALQELSKVSRACFKIVRVSITYTIPRRKK